MSAVLRCSVLSAGRDQLSVTNLDPDDLRQSREICWHVPIPGYVAMFNVTGCHRCRPRPETLLPREGMFCPLCSTEALTYLLIRANLSLVLLDMLCHPTVSAISLDPDRLCQAPQPSVPSFPSAQHSCTQTVCTTLLDPDHLCHALLDPNRLHHPFGPRPFAPRSQTPTVCATCFGNCE